MKLPAEARKVRPGTPRPLGATWDGEGTNFAVFSSHATQISVCIFEDDDTAPSHIIPLPEHTYGIWHGYVPGIGPGTRYGLRAHGDWHPDQGQRFNEHKLLVDPYARAFDGNLEWSDALYSYGLDEPDDPESRNDAPSDAFVPKSIVLDTTFDWGDDAPPRILWDKTVIYEVHVKGFTQQHPDIPEEIRGTYKAMAHPAAIDHLRSLGVTAVELLPVHAFVDDHFLVQRGLTNYWGYSTLGFFAPEGRYASDKSPGGQVREFREMVKALHAAGLEVILDVVYNHTCEGNNLGPTLAYRGLDNENYYRLLPGKPEYYLDFTGTGNSMNSHHSQVLTMMTDSLRYWVTEMHVDGFRFDLATTLGRDQYDFDPYGGFFDALHQDPILSTVKLIAEPWDIGEGGYQVGGFPVMWAEWNDKFRDGVRAFWQTNEPVLSDMGYRLTGSADLYEANGRAPHASINIITTHDGFTLQDMVSYEKKHNKANGEDNQDGNDYNLSANYGQEGPTDDPGILALRQRQKRNMLATLLFSQGTPMICGGDELGRTQQGNNNAYCQDNEISWFDWDLDDDARDLIAFTTRAIGIRLDQLALRRRRFFQGLPQKPGSIKDVTWLKPDGSEFTAKDWNDPDLRTIGMRLAGDAIQEIDDEGNPLQPSSVLLIFHAGEDEIEFVLPTVNREDELSHWTALLSTDSPDGSVSLKARATTSIDIPGRTVMMFVPSTSGNGE
ncbi:MAG TPA: glycogen debranching protein GlgX [Thermomicrobiales bacterium]|nr:glycogen debranching protein GlgX [Thermomicrobiales bacterium]